MREDSGQKIAEKITRFTNLEGMDVLEIGCGDGRITALLAGGPVNIIAIEPDSQKIEEARKKVPGVDFRTGSGERLEFPDKSFDLVVFTLSLHHQDSELALKEAERVLRDGGEILVIEPVADGELEMVFALVHDENQEKLAAQEAIAKSGLTVNRTEIFYGKWTFKDKAEACQSIFGHYGLSPDADTVQQMLELLKAKPDDRPMELADKMVIQSLGKSKG